MNVQIPSSYYEHFHPYVTTMVELQRKIWKSPTEPSTWRRCKYCLKSLNRITQWKGKFRRLIELKIKGNIQMSINISRIRNKNLRYKLRYKFRKVNKAELFQCYDKPANLVKGTCLFSILI